MTRLLSVVIFSWLFALDPATGADVMRCLSLADGSEIWRNGYPIEVVENHGMSRTVPALIDDCVISLGLPNSADGLDPIPVQVSPRGVEVGLA